MITRLDAGTEGPWKELANEGRLGDSGIRIEPCASRHRQASGASWKKFARRERHCRLDESKAFRDIHWLIEPAGPGPRVDMRGDAAVL